MRKSCECEHWASVEPVAWTHHPGCSSFNPGKDAREIIDALLKGIEEWAHDEDGVHSACWEAYKNARSFVMNPVTEKESQT